MIVIVQSIMTHINFLECRNSTLFLLFYVNKNMPAVKLVKSANKCSYL